MHISRLLFSLSMVLVVACGASEPESRQAAASSPSEISTDTVSLDQVRNTLELMGIVRAGTQASVAAQLMAQVKAAPVAVGDRVRRGQVLFELDSSELTARMAAARAAAAQAESAIAEARQAEQAAQGGVAAAEAQLRLAEATYQRFEALRERESVSPQEFDEVRSRRDAAEGELRRAVASVESAKARQAQAERGLQRAEAEIGLAETQLGYTRVRAPFDGVVTAKRAQVGDLATPGMPLLELDSEEGYQLVVEVPESHVGTVQPNGSLKTRIAALNQDLTGRVSEVQPGADPERRTFTVKLDLPPAEGLRSGLFGRLLLPVGTEEMLTVPKSALVSRGSLSAVFVVDVNGKPHLRLLKLGRDLDGRVEVLGGVQSGERVAAPPPSELRGNWSLVAN